MNKKTLICGILTLTIIGIISISGCVQEQDGHQGDWQQGDGVVGQDISEGLGLSFVEGDSGSWHVDILDTGLSPSWFRFDYLSEGSSLRCRQFESLEDAQNNINPLGEAIIDYVEIPLEGYFFGFGDGATKVYIILGISNFPPHDYAIYKYELIPESKQDDMVSVAQAREDIETYRKGDVVLTVIDAQGQPYSEAIVSYTQTNHSFLFTCHNHETDGELDGDYLLVNTIKQAGINSIFQMMNWRFTEQEQEIYDFDEWDSRLRVQDFYEAGLVGIGYSLSFASSVPEFSLVPDYAYSLSFDELKNAVYQYIHETVEYYKDEIKIWNIFNEPTLENALNLNEQQEINVIKESVNAARDVDSEAQIMINVWPPGGDPHSGMYPYDFLQEAIDAGVDFDIIGLEWYYNSYGASFWGGGPFPRLNLTSISEVIDEYSTLDKKLFISEISVPSEPIGKGYWGQAWSEELQAEYLEAIYTIFFSKPQVMGIGWWDVTDAGAFIYYGGLLDEQAQPKQAYYTLQNLINNWTTNGTGVTDDNGELMFRSFGGAYEIIVSDPETGISIQREVVIEEQNDNVFTFVLD